MLIRLDLPFADVRAGDLVLALGEPAHPALETLRAGRVELRLLGCSHQVLIDGGRALSETVACIPGRAGALPDAVVGDGYAFAAEVECLAPAAYQARADALLRGAGEDGRALAGLFPSAGATAFTLLRMCEPLAWETYHGYPQTGEIVVTRGRLG